MDLLFYAAMMMGVASVGAGAWTLWRGISELR